ncbi:putative membrane protein [Rubidibacter lacunae KORDI 51-2]|uniref:Putative membrane protein n=1 Tax=Rubidibacter lacunae KORDI 51-2 TaxID=582515 RepID=U5DQM9_9CHRO|nr:DUF1517 domain-containing protein [Rubidibacter lacunae]ERN42929.1 putative membrane protein [Rubidibacter lacunae KORDI 51-2]
MFAIARSRWQMLLKAVVALGLVLALVLGDAGTALAARSGGRIGGGSFRTPRTTMPRGGGGYRAPGGGFGFPFLFPFFGFGGFGSLFSILVVLALANFVINAFRSSGLGSGETVTSNPRVSVAKVQVGLLASASGLQRELAQLARSANTELASGRARVLQESALALLRHSDYWAYGATESQQMTLSAAESRFNQAALFERSKFGEETLSNANGRLQQSESQATDASAPSEYLLVTLLVGAEGKLPLSPIKSAEDLQQALREAAGVGQDRLLAVEVLWTPQAEGDSLTADDLLEAYPNLKLV